MKLNHNGLIRHFLTGTTLACALLVVSVSNAQTSKAAATSGGKDLQGIVNAAYAKFKDDNDGKNADYIPALAKVDPKLFGIALITVDGKVYTAGDVSTEVSIKSISKVFTMA